MPDIHNPAGHTRIPLTRFHNNTGEFLDLASKQPVILTSHGRDKHIIADSDYFRHLEMAAKGQILAHMDIAAVSASHMPETDLSILDASRPSAEELQNDRWND